MTSKKIDQTLLALGMVLIFISSYQLFLWRNQDFVQGLSLGTLEQTKSVVKIKGLSSLDWRDAYSGISVAEKQLIYTDANSSAEIKFLKGQSITISENSLIRISSAGESSGLNIERGLIRAKIQGNEPLIIEVNGSELKLTGENADVQISLQGDKGEIGVINGEVKVEKQGQVENINKSEALRIAEDSLTKHQIKFTLLEPVMDQVFYTQTPTERIEFKWSPESVGEVLLADNASFKKSKVFRGEGRALADIIPGSYYWKVEDEQGSSLGGSFTVIQEAPPIVLRPLNGEKIIMADASAKNEIFLQWKGVAGENYLVEWSNQETHELKVRGTGVLIPITASGAVNWRVKLDSPKRPLALWSDWQNVEVSIIEPPQVPQNLAPEELELQSYSKEAFDVELTWESPSTVELEIITAKNEKINKQLEEKTFTIKVSDAGEYRWRLRGIDRFKRLSDWTPWKAFKLEDLSHEVSTEGFQRVQLKKPDQSVTFNWKAEAETITVFELSETKDFKEVLIKQEVKGEEVSVVVPKVGNYYWRSRQYKADGTFNVSEPKKVVIEAAPAPAKPEKLPDVEVPIEWEETSIKTNSWLDLFISSAHADDVKGNAKILLPVVEEAKKYIVKIYSDANGENLLLEKTLESKTLDWKGAKPGQYYWQYALIDFWGRQSPFSDLSVLTVTGTQIVLPEKPTLVSPINSTEVESKNIKLKWSPSEKNKNYRLELSLTEDFKKIMVTRKTKRSEFVFEDGLPPAGFYWRVIATNDSKKEAISSVGRFSVAPPIEKITIVDKVDTWQKKYKTRVSIAWAPSMDTYEFKGASKKGEIDGNTLNSTEARGIYFTDKFIFSADLLRQSGKVFSSESYLFQRFQLHGTWKKKVKDHLWGPGLSIGSVAGYSYEIDANDEVKGSTVTGFIYGPHIEGFYTLNRLWELQGKLSYMLGAIPHMEITTEANRQMKNFYLLFGLSFSSREYKNDGAQSSIRMNIGLGKEF